MGLRDRFREILIIKDSPRRLAVAFAVGIFIGVSPFLGLHTIIGIAVAWIFRLNKIVTFTGVFMTNPWTIIPIYTFTTYVGAKCLGIKHLIPDIDWKHITFVSFLNELKPLLMPFFVGSLLVGFFSAVIGYFIIYHAAKKVRSDAK